MSWQNSPDIARRAGVGRTILLAVFAVLTLTFFRVQVVRSDRYRLVSEENRLRTVAIIAPRGLVIDRNGVVLAENVPGYSVALLAPSPGSLGVMLDRLQPILATDSATRASVFQRYRRAPTEPVVIRRDAPFEMVSALEELRPWNPGLVIQSDPKRRYPFGDVTAHLVGYVGEVTEQELEDRDYPGARIGTLVGRDGLERRYDDRLRGRNGKKFVEKDALGRTVREAGQESMLEPQPGETIRSTVDVELQQFVAATFPAGRRGAVVVMDPRSGEILALYSAPSYDPNLFIGGIDPEQWLELSQRRDFPLFNRATQARYAPASPWKLAVAAMALRRGIVDINSRMKFPCRGGMQYYNRYFRCWRAEGHGDLTLAEAIQYSCDVYFYQLGLNVGLTALLQDAIALGFGDPSGIDLPNEYPPIFPASTDYYNERYGRRGWTSAVTLNLAIGQGENTQTLINMVRFYAMLAHPRGIAFVPRLVAGNGGEPRSLDLSESALADLRAALVAVVDRGTAAGAQIADLRIAGKTGTAQNAHGLDHGWFIGFAPADNPRVLVGAIVEYAEHGSAVAPLATRIMARHLLGPDAVASRGGYRIETPADSAPESIPILPDTALLRAPSQDSARGAAARTR
jgi:penicillin-binding protein 2